MLVLHTFYGNMTPFYTDYNQIGKDILFINLELCNLRGPSYTDQGDKRHFFVKHLETTKMYL